MNESQLKLLHENLLAEIIYYQTINESLKNNWTIFIVMLDDKNLQSMHDDVINRLSKYTPKIKTKFYFFINNNSTLHEDLLKLPIYKEVITSETNIGFIEPNNLLFKRAKNYDYLLLLNSDVLVMDGWLNTLDNFCTKNPHIGLIGLEKLFLDENMVGSTKVSNLSYLSGWFLAIKSSVLVGRESLFDQNLKFAYGEDSDLCLELQKAGVISYKLSLDIAKHLGSKSIAQLHGSNHDSFSKNHDYLKLKWL